jgi:hypothetical protein
MMNQEGVDLIKEATLIFVLIKEGKFHYIYFIYSKNSYLIKHTSRVLSVCFIQILDGVKKKQHSRMSK